MHPHSRYQDLLGSERPEYFQESHECESPAPYWRGHEMFPCIDPQLHSLRMGDTHNNAHYPGSIDAHRFLTAYDPIAHGFSPPYQRHESESVLFQLGVLNPWNDNFDECRHLRYLSPTDPWGNTLSSTESSVSDYTLSPDVVRRSHDFPFPQRNREFDGPSVGASSAISHSWPPQPSFVPTLPSPPIPSSHPPLSMRDLQVTRDPEPVEEPMDDKDALHHKLHLPEELELSEQAMSPADSGLGQSIHDDDAVKDEENDCGARESDNDSEFLPAQRTPRRSTTVRRHSLRSPRRQAPRAVIDPSSRVQKPSHNRGALVHMSRSKGKRQTVKKLAPGAKSFPCTFHHYGCRASFASKNEWKRHVASQHLQLGFYRCDLGSCAPEVARNQHKGYNDFNRKDLFTQHCRRMHAPWVGTKKSAESVTKKERDSFEKQLEDIRARCWIDRRKAPAKSKCGFCGQTFEDPKGWEERMEHVGRHLERDGSKIEQEEVDDGLKQWAIAEGVVRPGRRKGEWWLVGFEPEPNRTPRGQRRSRRLIVEHEESAEEENEEDTDNDDEETEAEDEDSIEVHRGDVPMETDDNDDSDSDDADVDADSETDAEAEED
ncbi:uncharacterized protein Z518_09402 [Rhinocladiella mackenziei CBS 650.93]|uniref:C2H2-type domain-containing protein n=1 Tax=Rhinocladiella mackenziei CBS 650.93 TaxID=1442369 RepID=A0A0D2IEJ6_9EURO|nr:uncharacterized protein Z518_09402 [Rhinocladiella mackenziei CBS 650.93]KIX01676.1 hypothetical protein Z518_09402 [Rhinocladiella mackenziei CBS 650.93]